MLLAQYVVANQEVQAVVDWMAALPEGMCALCFVHGMVMLCELVRDD